MKLFVQSQLGIFGGRGEDEGTIRQRLVAAGVATHEAGVWSGAGQSFVAFIDSANFGMTNEK